MTRPGNPNIPTAIKETADRYRKHEGRHDGEWDRFLVQSFSFHDAAEVAAQLGWWLHCWKWEQVAGDDIIVVDRGFIDSE